MEIHLVSRAAQRVSIGALDLDIDFEPGEEDANALLPHEIADLVSHVVASRRGVVFDEISLTPLKRVLRFRSGKRVGPESP